MRAWKAVASTLALSGADVVVTTLLYAHGRRGQDILQDLRHFNIFNSLLDIWGGCLYRSCVLLGAADCAQHCRAARRALQVLRGAVLLAKGERTPRAVHCLHPLRGG